MKYITKSLVINTCLVGIAVVASYNAARMVHSALNARMQSQDLAKKIDDLKKKKQELEAELAEIRTQDAVEREAKERLDMKKQGEEVVVVVPEKKQTASSTPQKTIWDEIMSFFRR